MADLILRHAAILKPGEMVHLTRATLTGVRPKALHGHDFYELIWVQNGRVRHHLADIQHDLSEGDMLFLRPRDRHALQGRGENALVVSVTIHPDLVEDLAKRHGGLSGRLFWAADEAPVQVHRDMKQLAEVNQAALRLERARRDALEAEAFLLPLFAALTEFATLVQDAPLWLTEACIAAQDPRIFREGAAGFVRVAGRAHPHVSRTMRRFMGQSPSDYVNSQRMGYAARRLTGTGDSLAEIAADCGIPNMSHFHKLFREAHGMTPQRYRRAHQRDVVQPD